MKKYNKIMNGKIALTSQGFSDHIVKEKIKSLVDCLHTKRVAFIVTASRDKAKNKYNQRDRDIFLNNFRCELVDFIDLEDTAGFDFSNYNIIYVAGGNTFKLLKYARAADLSNSIINLLNRGGLYIGVSCGSLILSSSVLVAEGRDENKEGITDYSGFGIVPYIIYPHYSPSDEAEITKFERENKQKITRLNDQQCLVYDPLSHVTEWIGVSH